MLGFAAFLNGFSLSGGGSCIFNSLYPIGGTVSLNGGTLSLSKDVIFQKGISFVNGGTILANNRKISFLDTDQIQLPDSGASFPLVAYITQLNTAKSVISCDWSCDGSCLAVANSGSSNLGVYCFNGKELSAAGTQTATTNFLCVRWHPTLNYFVSGRVQSGSLKNIQLWQYTPANNSITLLDQQSLNKNITALAWHPSGDYVAVGTASGGTGIAIYAFSNNELSYVTQVNLSPSRNVSANALSWDSTGTYLVVGTASSSASKGYEVLVYTFNGAALTLNAYLDIDIAVSSVSYSPHGNFVAIGLSTGTERLQIYNHNPAVGTLTKLSKASLTENRSVVSVAWSPDGNYLAIGRAAGTDTEFRVYSFNATNTTLTLVNGFENSGTVNDIAWSHDGNFVVVGDSKNIVSVFGFSTNLVFNAAHLEFNSDVTFNAPTIFKDSCAIYGNNKTIRFGSQGSIRVDSGASLVLKNVVLPNITAANFYCADQTSTVIFDNVVLALALSDYDFNVGSFNVVGLLHIMGPYGFNYQTDQVSAISANGTLLLDQGATFNYNPSIPANNLFTLADATASLVLRSATFQVSNTGLQLTKGYFEMDGSCSLINSGVQASQGLVLGDGISAANNVILRVLPEAQCVVNSGFIVDKSV